MIPSESTNHREHEYHTLDQSEMSKLRKLILFSAICS